MAPRLFSFNSPAGACPQCAGLGIGRLGGTRCVAACIESAAVFVNDCENAIADFNFCLSELTCTAFQTFAGLDQCRSESDRVQAHCPRIEVDLDP